MPYLVRWSGNALTGLQRVYTFLAEKNEEAAVAAFKTIRQAALLLETYPEAGRPADDLDPEHRELLIPFGGAGYLALYKVREKDILILALKHQKEVGY